MDVILLGRVGRLGNLGETVKVKAGFARNYLFPQGKAVPNNESNRTKFEARRADLEQAATALLEAAQQKAEALKAIPEVVITARAADQGKLYGSIGAREIAEAIAAAGVDVEKKDIHLPEGAIRTIGEFDINIHLHSDVVSTLKLVVKAE